MTAEGADTRPAFLTGNEDASVRRILEGTAGITGERFFAALVEALSRVLGTYGAWVSEYIAPSRQLRTLALWVDGRLVPEVTIDIAGTPCEAVIDGARLVHYPERLASLFAPNPLLRDIPAVSYMGVPLLDGAGGVIGNLAVIDNRPMPEEPQAQLLFRLFAAGAGAELQRTRVEAEIRKSEEKYRRIVETTGEGFLLTDTDWIINDVNDAFCRLVGVPREEVLGRTPLAFLPESQRRAWVDRRQEMVSGQIRELEGNLVSKDGRTIPVLIHPNTLRDDAGGTMGYMVFVTNISEHKKSLALAAEVQKSLMPQGGLRLDGLEVAGRTIACDDIGGDYFDFVHGRECARDGFDVVVGDVVGHGVDAALLMMSARGFLRMRASQCGSLSQIVTELNAQLVSDFSRSGRFMTLFYLSIDPCRRTLRWVRAGHDPALFYDPKQDRFEALDGGGLAMGVEEGHRYRESARTDLAPGQIIAIATDGIWEARDKNGRMFGKQRLQDTLRRHAHRTAAQIVGAVLETLEHFAAGIKPGDDITLVVVKLTDLPPVDFQI